MKTSALKAMDALVAGSTNSAGRWSTNNSLSVISCHIFFKKSAYLEAFL
jgi:hypothetical protein